MNRRSFAPEDPNKDDEKVAEPEKLKGWQQIASFLGEPIPVVQRWANEGMPVHRRGRFIFTTADELNSWLRRESGKPVQVATDNTDLTAELKRGLSFVRHEKRSESEREKERKKA
jgi:phage terminase Nu1 subunit (DNA packaging protein)